jgi:hypothetical protein
MDANVIAFTVAVIGVAGTLLASAIGHVFTLIRENRTWARERQRQVDEWSREDARRASDRRYDAYLAYLAEAERAHSRSHLLWVEPLRRTKADVDLVVDSLEALATAQALVMVHGTAAARHAAADLYNAVAAFVYTITTPVLADWVDDPVTGGAGPNALSRLLGRRNRGAPLVLDDDAIEGAAAVSLGAIKQFRTVIRKELAPVQETSIAPMN